MFYLPFELLSAETQAASPRLNRWIIPRYAVGWGKRRNSFSL